MSWWRSLLTLALVCAWQLAAVHGQIWPPKADVVFVLDSSNSVGASEWEALRTMLLSLTQTWTIGPDSIQVGVITYGGGVHNEFFLNGIANSQQLTDALTAVTFRGGTSDAAQAFRFAYSTSFSSQNGARAGVPHIIVHITDGPAADPDLLVQEAKNARNQGITIFNIGVGLGIDAQQLGQVASDPGIRYVLQADTYSSLTSVVEILSSRIQHEVPVSAQALPPANACLTKADLVLLVDSSSSVGQEDFERLEDFVKDLVVQLPIGPDQVQVGLVQFSDHPSLEFPLNMYQDRLAMLKAVDTLQFMGGGTNTGGAIDYVASNLFTKAGGARTDVPRIVVVVTDGQSLDPTATAAAADRARAENIGLVAVGVGRNINEEELQKIANDPDPQYVFQVENYKDLKAQSTEIIKSVCTVNTFITAQPTVPSGAPTTEDPCQDAIDHCYDYPLSVCSNDTYIQWAQVNCARRCGFCTPAEERICEDKLNDCSSYGTDMCTNVLERGWAYENCRRFCGLCDAGVATLGFYNKCMYKGIEYMQSEQWEDGCDYKCVCENARTGHYRCYNRCPVYHDLPPECTLVGVPGECCLKPVCDFHQRLNIQEVVPASGPVYNSQNIPMCAYLGKQYYQGQTWENGCTDKCVCNNATLGAYTCQSFCPQYDASTLPPECRLVQRPGQCCSEPVCEFNTQTGSFAGYGTLSGIGIERTPQPGAVCQDEVVDCENYGQDVCTEYDTWARENCAKHCGFCTPSAVTPGPNDFCYYYGEPKQEGQVWQISCDTECICENAAYGYYRCYSSCPTYLNLPAGCVAIDTPGWCCQTVQCQHGTYYPSSTNLLSIGNGGGLTVLGRDGHFVEAVPTLSSGSTVPPGTSGGSAGLQNIRLDGCLFNGRMYVQNQQWHDGCNLTCSCQDAATGRFICRERCPSYENVPTGCGTRPDPNDPCCEIPDCPASISYVAIPVYGRSQQSIGAVVTPNLPELMSGMYTTRFTMYYSAFTVAPPSTPTGTFAPGGLDYCEYDGRRYGHGETWEVGCDYNCVCEDAYSGLWHCVDKCEKYVDLPKPYCHLERDPDNLCCQRPVCNFLAYHGEFMGNNTIPTTAATSIAYRQPMCVYNGREYAEGQTWYDGCELKCRCDKADQNIYTCLSRCPTFPDIYDGCDLVTDPNDPACCRVPLCEPTLGPTPGLVTGTTPFLTPTPVPVLPPGLILPPTSISTTGFCVYGGVSYKQGETWVDGCDYSCTCQDQLTGRYECTELCQKFGPLPEGCRLITDFRNPCCQVPSCTSTAQPTPTPTGPVPTGPTPRPTPEAVCVYNEARFYQGQTWEDGCDFKCRCEDAVYGFYVCVDRCKKYTDLPPECRMITDPDDPCCTIPDCVPEAVVTTTGAPSPGSTVVPQKSTTTIPVPSEVSTLKPGRVEATANFPTPSPSSISVINFCVYKGVPYAKGATWQDGCDFNCVCEDPVTGHYVCTERCPRYNQLPSGCILIKDATDPCCMTPICGLPFMVTALSTSSSQRTTSTVTPPLPFTVTTVSPTASPTPSPTARPLNMCVYKGQYYSQGQTWYDNCDYSCTCEDAEHGIYRCIQRCPAYTDLPPECTLGPDPQDPVCCEQPLCVFVPSKTNFTGIYKPPIPTPILTGGLATPTPHPLLTPVPGTEGSTQVPLIPRDVCIYNGRQYKQGQRWADGCRFNCECVDAMTAKYQCQERCVRYSSVPERCNLIPDPADPCCEILFCSTKVFTAAPPVTITPQPTPTPFRGPDGSTIIPPKSTTLNPNPQMCIYNGVPYATGQTWYDGCDLRCICVDGTSNQYRCNQRCFTYDLPADCTLVTDPRDSCCHVPKCPPIQPPTPSPGPSPSTIEHPMPPLQPVSVPGIIVGQGSCPADRWNEGCDRVCECVTEADVGYSYKCTERCMRYIDLPYTCQMVVDPNDSCCKIPKCTPTAFPTPEPWMTPVSSTGGTSQIPGTGPTPGPITAPIPHPRDVCVYNGQYYINGQQWYDGCEKECICLDVSINLYRCQDRCATYDNVPEGCQMVPSPDDPQCCQVPQCVPTAVPTDFSTPPPGQTTTPMIYTNPPGRITGMVPTPTAEPGVSTPTPRTACYYNGKEYRQGMEWQDGCQYTCMCINETTGYYRCFETCPKYPVVPRQCSLVQDETNFCCKRLECDWTLTTPNPSAPPTPRPTLVPNPFLHTTVTPPVGETTETVTPGTGPTPATSFKPPTLAPSFSFCVYNGVPYRQGDTWEVGCDLVCSCDNSSVNYYTCADRCPSYAELPQNCRMVVNENDPCCLVPECYEYPTYPVGYTPEPGVTLAPGATPPPIPTGVPGVIVGQPNIQRTETTHVCTRNGIIYSPGQTWDEGCEYRCKCEDETGRYTCTERCVQYPNVPAYCTLQRDINDQCCLIPICPTVEVPATTPGPLQSTVGPSPGVSPRPTPAAIPVPKDVCVYNSRTYLTGQTWYSGCDQVCVCEDGKIGFYRCSQRCATFQNVPPTCKMVPDSRDPACCMEPLCTNPQNPVNITGNYGVIVGNGKPPAPTQPSLVPGATPTPAPDMFPVPPYPANVCVYDGNWYTQGQKWQDGCDYNCECINSTEGTYRCMDRCPRYPQSIATYCTMVRDPLDPCCMVPDCNATPAPPGVIGSTVAPLPMITPFPTLHPTLTPGLEFCVYKGIPYSHGQTWNDGCDFICRCEDVVTGQVNCDDRCPTYTQIPPECEMVTDPKDPCCQVPVCPPSQPNTNIQTLVLTGNVGTITGQSLPPNHPSPIARSNECIYHGRTYQQGERWDDGCTYTCECIDAQSGRYMCFQKCPRIPRLPPTCQMVQDPNDKCCLKPYCEPWPTVGTPPPTTGPTVPGATPTLSLTLFPSDVCVYKGDAYREGQEWYDGCNAICRCEDGSLGFYRCQSRCVRYQNVPAECTMVPDKKDPTCCEVPDCPFYTPSPSPGVTPTPGIITGIGVVPPGTIIGIGKVPTPAPTLQPVTGPDGSIITVTPAIGCYYKGRTYLVTDGQWEDGCDFVCECLDDSTGRYQCTQKCSVLTQFPEDRCVLVQDPQEPCCMTPYCDFTNLIPFPSGTPTPFPPLSPTSQPPQVTSAPTGVPTPEPSFIPGFCVYHGVYYRQEQTWYDGCDYVCECIDASTGFYTCRGRCKNYNIVASECTLKTDPSDSCCLVPDCTPASLLVTPETPLGFTGTSAPGQSTIGGFTGHGTLPPQGPITLTGSVPGVFTGISGVKPPTGIFGVNTGYSNACVYKGVIYHQGDMWLDGCDYACTCIDALRGEYQCVERCTSFYFLPESCVMEPDPDDITNCCKVARCYPATPSTATVSGFTGTGTTVQVTPTIPSFTGTATTVSVTPHFGTGPTGQGSTGGPIQTTQSVFTGRHGGCLYDGQLYGKGEVWTDGCDYRCTCNDDLIGLYTCTYLCPAFSGLPEYCELQRDPANACCKKPVCEVQGTTLVTEVGGTPTLSPTLQPSVTNVIPLGTHTILTGNSPMPLPIGQGVITTVGGRHEGCVYKDKIYIPGETWDDGCDYTCTCYGQEIGFYRCVAKCPSYPALPSYCSMYNIPGLCCASLSCNIPISGSYKPAPQIDSGPRPTPFPDSGLYPTPPPITEPQIVTGYTTTMTGTGNLSGNGTDVPAGYVNNTGGLRGKCVYQMKMYNQGEEWGDGCSNCECQDSFTGYYVCTARCPTYNQTTLPKGCVVTINPDDPCCELLTCVEPGGQQTTTNITQILQLYPIVGSFSGTISGFRPGYLPPSGSYDIVAGQTNGCVYKGVLYGPGVTWEDGCDFDCICMDGVTGLYQCTSKCVTYSLLPPMCRLIAQEGECCEKVTCEPETPPPDTCRDKLDDCYSYGSGEQCRGAYLNWAQDHCPLYCGFCTPSFTTTPEPCIDVLPNCEAYGSDICSVPGYDRWIHDNCRKFCDKCMTTTTATTTEWTTPESGCFDAISYCADYGVGICSDVAYTGWVQKHCQRFCGKCDNETTTGPGTTTPSVCKDKIDNCELYGSNACLGQYLSWAMDNCRATCGYCEENGTTVAVQTTTPPPICNDTIDNCADYGTQYCDGVYLAWAADNCAAFCHLCDEYEITTVQMVAAPGWVVLMKGVSGVTGDLWRLWSGTATANENVPAAQYLTNEFRGNYKSSFVNSWSTCNFDRVKVAIYSNGVEKVNIIFDVRHSGRNNWFRPENIISSTWNDLDMTSDLFNIATDENGHMFTVGEFHGCAGTGWLFVSSQQNCHYEADAPLNRFFYSENGQVAHLNSDQLGEGDVFAILGQGGLCAAGGVLLTTQQSVITGMNNFCFYKGHTYNQYEVWQDGCQYNCTCLDVTTGYYSCVDLCPTYTNLPSGCHMEKPAGECCERLNCPHVQGNGCVYKNISYPEGATWQDNCDYSCRCEDGITGYYVCQTLCPDWGTLPDVCSLADPQPGKCCPTPQCPDGYSIQTPQPPV